MRSSSETVHGNISLFPQLAAAVSSSCLHHRNSRDFYWSQRSPNGPVFTIRSSLCSTGGLDLVSDLTLGLIASTSWIGCCKEYSGDISVFLSGVSYSSAWSAVVVHPLSYLFVDIPVFSWPVDGPERDEG